MNEQMQTDCQKIRLVRKTLYWVGWLFVLVGGVFCAGVHMELAGAATPDGWVHVWGANVVLVLATVGGCLVGAGVVLDYIIRHWLEGK